MDWQKNRNCATDTVLGGVVCVSGMADGVEIAKVWCDGDQFPEHGGEANARLIAKAPELLEQLRFVVDFATEGMGDECGDDPFEDARALIAEIEGGEV